MSIDTSIGGGKTKFPATRLSAVILTHSANEQERTRAFSILIATYWKPIYKYVRIKWRKGNEDAKDLTQGFFARALEKGYFDTYDPAKARFRTFLRLCVDGYVANENKAAGRIKRGGEATILSLDFEGAEQELLGEHAAAEASMDSFFDQEWVRSLFTLAVEHLAADLAGKGKQKHFELFLRYDIQAQGAEEKLTYDQLAQEFSLSVTDVTNYLAVARREFRTIVLDQLQSLTATEEEFRSEAKALLGVDL